MTEDGSWPKYEEFSGPSLPVMVPLDDGAFYERTAFKHWDLVVGFGRLASNESSSEAERDLAIAAYMALMGMHPTLKLNVEHPPKNGFFSNHARAIRRLLSFQVADEIDIAVANGLKLESGIRDAEQRYGLSRREVFRMLREIRNYRLEQAEAVRAMPGTHRDYHWPDGLTIDAKGRFVPK